ncbi:MAG: RNA-binding S4 domain-containing protein [Candidatus Eremiobacteraeota bacterium]|nr:RNA-binding S4 domain-containing protein [Candidatus Eremiobacteraeota bacterium]
MRVDKFLKVSRLAKRRSEAHEALVAGRITREGRALKPGYEVREGDVIVLHYVRKFLTVRVLHVPLRVTPALRDIPMYEVLEERKDDPVDWLDGAPAGPLEL